MSLIELMPEEAEPRSAERTALVMGYELGSVQRSLVYASHKHAQGDYVGKNAHLQSARIELADLITQCQLLAEQMGWKWLELENDGRERFGERMREIEEGTL